MMLYWILRFPTQMVDTKDYITYIKSQPCIVCGQSPVDPDHLQARGMGGIGKKGTITGTTLDFSCIPLCREHHSERGNTTLKEFQEKYRVNLWKDAFMCLRRYFVE
jgi:hypothetical protein